MQASAACHGASRSWHARVVDAPDQIFVTDPGCLGRRVAAAADGIGGWAAQVEQQEHVQAFYDEDDPSRRTKTFANAVFTIPSNSNHELSPFGGPIADLLPAKAHQQRLERGALAKVRSRPPPA